MKDFKVVAGILENDDCEHKVVVKGHFKKSKTVEVSKKAKENSEIDEQ